MEPSNDFDYLREVAREYGNMYLVEDLVALAANITGDQLTQLRTAYEAIATRNHAVAISRWRDRVLFDTPRPEYRDRRFAQDIGGLFNVFQYLADAGLPPFSSRAVRYVEEVKLPDWSTVPDELRYLIPPAEKYGVHYSESAMLDFLDHATAEDMEILARTSERMRINGHLPVLYKWMDNYPFRQHQEAWLLYCLMGVLDHAGLLEM